MSLLTTIRHPFSSSKRTMRNGLAHLGDGLTRQTAHGKASFSGWASGKKAINQLRRDAKTFGTRELLDDKEATQALKHMHKAARHLKKYDEQHLAKLQEKWAEQPTTLHKKITTHVNKFTKDFEAFQTNYRTFILRVNDMLVKEAQELADENAALPNLLQDFAQNVHKTNMVIPEQTIRGAQKRVQHLLNHKMNDYRREAREDRKISTGKKISLFSIKGSKAMHKAKKLIVKIRREEEKDLRQSLRRMRQELTRGVEQDFLSLFEEHLKNLEHLEKIYLRLHHDIMLTIQSAKKELEGVADSITLFFGMFRNDPAVQHSRLPQELEALKKDLQDIEQVLDTDRLDAKRLYQQILSLNARLTNIFSQITSASNNARHNLLRNPQAQLQA